MACNTCSSTLKNLCPSYPDSHCIIYTGGNLSCSGVSKNDRLDTIISKLDSKICNIQQSPNLYNFTNGLTESPALTVKLGGSLSQNTTLDFLSFSVTLPSVPFDDPPAYFLGLNANNNVIRANGSNFQFANSYFDDGDSISIMALSSVQPALRVGDVIYGMVNDYSGEVSTYSKVSTFDDGNPMSDSDVDGFIFRKKGAEYFKLNYHTYHVKLFGAKPDYIGAPTTNATTNRQAILNAIKFMPHSMDSGSTQPSSLGKIWFSRGLYFVDGDIPVTRVCHFIGEGSFVGSPTIISFPANSNGFEVFRYNTRGTAPDCTSNVYSFPRAADGTIFENLQINQQAITGITTSTLGWGIHSRASFEMYNCSITNWKGMGVWITANAVATEDANKIKNIFVAARGTGFTTVPTVVITPNPTGSGATATAVLGGGVSGITLTSGGSGYVEVPTIIVKENGDYLESNVETRGYGAEFDAHMGVNTITVTNGGSGYTSATITINSPNGSGATATATLLAGVITAITVTAPGTGYLQTSTMSVTITGDGTAATAVITDLLVVSTSIHTGGVNYESTDIPRVYFVDGRRGTGSAATGTVTSLVNFKLKRIIINTRGDGYCAAPVITITGGGGSGAIAWASRYGEEAGNANRWKLRDCRISNNGYGLYVEGGDVNAGSVIGCDASDNAMYGMVDKSFLGNTYIACHTNGNDLGPYFSTGNTANNLYLNCYSEGNQPPSVGINPANFLMGTHGAGIRGTARTDNSPIGIDRVNPDGSMNATLFGDFGADELMRVNVGNMDAGGTMRWKFDQETLDQSMDWYNQPTLKRNWLWTGPQTALTFGRTGVVPYAVYNQQLFVGTSTTTARQIAMASAFPPTKISGQVGWAVGDFVFNRIPAPSSGRTLCGWHRLTQGTNDVLDTDWVEVITRTDANITSTARAGISLTTTGSSGLATYNSSTGVLNVPNYNSGSVSVNAQTGTTYTAVIGDANNMVTMNNSSANTFTIPTNAAVPYTVGTQIVIGSIGAGQTTIAATGGVTIISAGSALKLRTQGSVAAVIKLATDTWLLSGDIST